MDTIQLAELKTDTLESYQALRQDYQRQLKELRTKAQGIFGNAVKGLFDKYSEDDLKSISWRQYTPYFNDGDECRFNVYRDWIDVNGEEVWCPKEEPLKSIVVDFDTIMNIFDDEDLKTMFGDHVKITITRDGVHTQQYSHD